MICFVILSFCLVCGSCTPLDIVLTPLKAVASPLISAYITWKNGEAIKFYRGHQDHAYRATKRALVQLNFEIAEEKAHKNGYSLSAKAKNTATVSIKQEEKNITRISIRMNWLGNHELAEVFYETLEKELLIIEYGEEGNVTPVPKIK